MRAAAVAVMMAIDRYCMLNTYNSILPSSSQQLPLHRQSERKRAQRPDEQCTQYIRRTHITYNGVGSCGAVGHGHNRQPTDLKDIFDGAGLEQPDAAVERHLRLQFALLARRSRRRAAGDERRIHADVSFVARKREVENTVKYGLRDEIDSPLDVLERHVLGHDAGGGVQQRPRPEHRSVAGGRRGRRRRRRRRRRPIREPTAAQPFRRARRHIGFARACILRMRGACAVLIGHLMINDRIIKHVRVCSLLPRVLLLL